MYDELVVKNDRRVAMKKMMSVVLVGLFAVPPVFGVNQTRKWTIENDFNVTSFKDDSLNNCKNSVNESYEKDVSAAIAEHGNTSIPFDVNVNLVKTYESKMEECEKEYKVKPQQELKRASYSGAVFGGLACTALAVVVGKCASDHPLKKTA